MLMNKQTRRVDEEKSGARGIRTKDRGSDGSFNETASLVPAARVAV